MFFLEVPEVDVGRKVEFADNDVTFWLIVDAAGQANKRAGHIWDGGYLVDGDSTYHLSKLPAGFDDERQPFLPILAVLAPVSHELVNRVEDWYGRWTGTRVVEVGSSGGDGYLFSDEIDIQRDTEVERGPIGQAEYKWSARWCGSSGRLFRRCSSCTRTGFSRGCTGHGCQLLCFRSGR